MPVTDPLTELQTLVADFQATAADLRVAGLEILKVLQDMQAIATKIAARHEHLRAMKNKRQPRTSATLPGQPTPNASALDTLPNATTANNNLGHERGPGADELNETRKREKARKRKEARKRKQAKKREVASAVESAEALHNMLLAMVAL